MYAGGRFVVMGLRYEFLMAGVFFGLAAITGCGSTNLLPAYIGISRFNNAY